MKALLLALALCAVAGSAYAQFSFGLFTHAGAPPASCMPIKVLATLPVKVNATLPVSIKC